MKRNAGPWEHDDGTPCPGYYASEPTPSKSPGQTWWCTEHQQHVHVAAPTPEVCPSPVAPNGVHLGSPCDFCGVKRHVTSCPRNSGADYCWCGGAPAPTPEKGQN